VLQYTPFPYQLYFPVSLYLGKVSGADLIRGFTIQAGWVLIMYCMARFVWNRGIRKYSAVGG
jgi:ABC-2 type transport system permease protein